MYRLALDLGTNSIGWCLFSLDELPDKTLIVTDILRSGVRIFSDGRDPQSGASLAEDRRVARQARRRRDRFVARRNHLMQILIAYGLMPEIESDRKSLENKDPYIIRAQALDTALHPYDLGRALFHINQRRGFKSNRKTDKSTDDKGVVKSGIKALRARLAGANARSLGEYLHICKQSGQPTRARSEGEGAKPHYPFYPERSLLEDEFDKIRAAQAPHHANLSPERWDTLRHIIFHQRPLKEVLPGRCSLFPSQFRAPIALPLAQKVRILQELNHLRIVAPDFTETRLTLAQRDAALAKLLAGSDLAFTALRKLWDLEADYTFNLERSTEDKLKGDLTAKKMSDKKTLGPAWAALGPERQARLVELLLAEEDEETLQAILTAEFGLSPEFAHKAAEVNLPDGYASHCREALNNLAREMEKDVISYAEARQAAGYPYKDPTGEIKDNLPYYGVVLERYVGKTGAAGDTLEKRYGRIANPTVHVALNQLRRIVNEIIKEFGLPTQVVMEVARDLKNGRKAKEEIRRRQMDQKKANDMRRAKLEEQKPPIKVTADSLLRMRLWEELAPDDCAARCCPYTGEHISFTRLFGDDVEIEHILPLSRTLDDSPANKTVSLRRANRDKGNQSPFEAFHNKPGYVWAEIQSRAANLPKNKRWRFAEDAMEQFDKDEGFLDRQLKDTQYIAKVAREYLCAVCPQDKVWVTPGRLTGHLRHAWGFPKKDRNSHRHHAVDAAVIGMTEPSLLQRAARYSATQNNSRFLANFSAPWPHFKDHVLEKVDAIIISHKADHGLEAALHGDTAYGILAPNGQPKNAQHRKAVGAFKKPEDLLAIKEIKLRTELLRDISEKPHAVCLELLQRAESMREKEAKTVIQDFASMTDKEFTAKFQEVTRRRGIRGIRIVETAALIPIRDKKGDAYKGVIGASNAWYDIYEDESGKWIHDVVSTFDANNERKNHDFISPHTSQGRKHIMRLFKNDMLELEDNTVKKYYYVLKFTVKGPIYLVEHMEANADKRNSNKNDPFKLEATSANTLRKMKAKEVFITPAGKIIYKKRPCRVATSSGNKRK